MKSSLKSGDIFLPRLSAALQAMHHRGPDDVGTWASSESGVALGSARLIITGGVQGSQPIVSEDGQVVAAVNGEFYEHRPLRKHLEEKGHRFSTTSDSELAVHLYEEYGLDFVHHLRGEFAIVLWDNRLRRFVAVRDRFGIKPLHWTEQNGEWMLASEIKALLATGVPARWNTTAYAHALTHQYLLPAQTLFHGIHQIPPAHLMIMEQGQQRFVPYWKPNFLAAVDEDSVTAPTSEEILLTLENSVRMRAEADVPVACTLSGGLDSSSVAMLTARTLSRPVTCYSVRFDDPAYDEGRWVHEDAAACQGMLQVREVPVTRRDLAFELERSVWASEGLAINGQLVGKHLLSRALHQDGYRVVLAGEGADEAFLGYAHLQADRAALGRAPALDAFPLQTGVMLPEAGASIHWRPPAWLGFVPTFLQAKLAFARHYAPLLTPAMQDTLSGMDYLGNTVAAIHATGELAARPAPERQSAWLWTRMALANYILRTLGDAAEMASSVEARLPFLDHKLFDLAARIPVSACLVDGQSKNALREALRGVVPETVRVRPKHPFLAPSLLSSGDRLIRDWVHDTLTSSDSADLPFFDSQELRKWVEKLLKSTPEEQALLDPVLTTLLTSTFLQKGYRLTV